MTEAVASLCLKFIEHGLLSSSDDNITQMIQCDAVKIIVSIMENHFQNINVLQLATKVLSNFGAMKNEEERFGAICIVKNHSVSSLFQRNS